MVKKWTFNGEPGLTAYLLENGTILRSGKPEILIRGEYIDVDDFGEHVDGDLVTLERAKGIVFTDRDNADEEGKKGRDEGHEGHAGE